MAWRRGAAPAMSVAFVLLLALLPGRCYGQDDRKTNAGSNPSNKIVSVAPEAELLNGVDDVDAEGNCMDEVKHMCSDVTPGEGQLAECLSDAIAEAEMGAGNAVSVSDACREAVYQYKIYRSININLNVPLARACKVDAEKRCNTSWLFGRKSGQVVACLRLIKDEVAPACKRELFKVMQDAAEDFRADPDLYEACKDDAQLLCGDVQKGGGRVQACLRHARQQLSWRCEEQLFRQEAEDADDVRLSVRLFARCLEDKRQLCADVAPGGAAVKDCLEEHRHELSDGCRAEVDGMLERRVEDFRLDSRLVRYCRDDITATCAVHMGNESWRESSGQSVRACLQDFIHELKNESCAAQVHKYMQLASEDVRFDLPLADACRGDRNRLCANEPPGSAGVWRCLLRYRTKLEPRCSAVLFDEEIKFSESIDFQQPMQSACAREVEQFCAGVPSGDARVIRCLQDAKYQKDFGEDCRARVQEYEAEAASDYRFNHRLAAACAADVPRLCGSVCAAAGGQTCGGTVLRCLTVRRDDIEAPECRAEVEYFEKMEVNDFRNDVILAAACRDDVEKLCKDVQPGEGRVHDCLRDNHDQLSAACRKEELLLEEEEADAPTLRPGLVRRCRSELRVFCRDVAPGAARLFRCLAQRAGDADFGEPCRAELRSKLSRRQANWKLDPPLRKACKDAVARLCRDEDGEDGETGAVYRCMMRQYTELDTGCQRELGRALHMALFAWSRGGAVTSQCDADVDALCLAKRPNLAASPGGVLGCLAGVMDSSSSAGGSRGKRGGGARLSAQCAAVVDVAQPPDIKSQFDAGLLLLAAVEDSTGLSMLLRDRAGGVRGVTLTGWTALAGVAAAAVLAIWSVRWAWRRARGEPSGGYALVIKAPRRPRQ